MVDREYLVPAFVALLAAGALSSSCHDKPVTGVADARVAAIESVAREPGRPGVAVALIDRLARCEVDHGGVLIDLGSPSAQGVTGSWSLGADPALLDSERDGETWTKVSARTLTLRFVLDQAAPLFVGVRARGGIARSAAVALDGKPLGIVPLVRGQARIAYTRATASPISAGAHVVELRFSSSSRTQNEPMAEVDWVRMASVDDDSRTYAPPTLNQLVANTSLGGAPHRSVALRAPSTLRCSMLVQTGARLRVAVGFEGQGEGEGEIRISKDGEPAVLLRSEHVRGGDRAEWSDIDLPLDRFEGKVVTLELRSKGEGGGGRLLFGDPIVYLVTEPARSPPARLAVLVVLAGIDRTKLANHQMYPTMAELERSGATFAAHRVPTTVSAGVVASLLTGLSPRAHGIEDQGARLPGSLTTLGVAARDGSVQTAMFTGCPPTFEAFGFARGWDKYVAYSPVEGAPAIAPLTDSSRWTIAHMKAADARALVVVHARGGHPPWDVTVNEAAKLPPPEYSGPIDPRRGGQVIARARARHSRFRLTENDRTRMWSIYDAALAGQDHALGQFVDALKRAGLWDQTLFVVTGDVSTSSDNRAPFGDGEDLAEPLLHVPLWVHFPAGALAGLKVEQPTAVIDLSRTVLDALGLPTPDVYEGVDLFTTATGGGPAAGRPIAATLGPRYSLRLGDLVLSGTAGKPPALCDLSLDPSCDVDRLDRMPRAASLLFRFVYDEEAAAQKQRHAREPATVDADTAAAILVWGD